MYELNRIRLVGIGPRGARYGDVVLDLSGAGDPVPSQSLFESVARRPARSSLLLLENGGGKSVLLKLIFSVLLPGRNKTVGGVQLDKFVREGDTSHVALEWLHVETGERLVTGKVMQHRGRQGGDRPVAEAWYSFRPVPGMGLSLLPVSADGRRTRLDGFREGLVEADRTEPTMEFAWFADSQEKWKTHLRGRGIDPALFDIQRRMNVDEGEAAKAFQFSSAKQFVDWLLSMTTDDDDMSSVATTFQKWAVTLAERDSMLRERDFLDGAIIGLDDVATKSEAHTSAQTDAQVARGQAEQLSRGIGSRVDRDQAALAELAERAGAATVQFGALSGERDAARNRMNEVRLQTLQLQLTDAQEQLEAARDDLEAATIDTAGWRLLPQVHEIAVTTESSRRLRDEVSRTDSGAAPLLARRDDCAADLLAKYSAETAQCLDDANRHLKDASRAEQDAEAADARSRKAVKEQSRCTERARGLRQQVDQVTARVNDAISADLLPSGTTAHQVPELAERARLGHTQLEATMRRRRADLSDRGADLLAAQGAEREAEKAQTRAQQRLDTAASQLTTAIKTAEQIASLPGLARVVAGSATVADDDEGSDVLSADDLDAAAERLLGVLSDDSGEQQARVDELRVAQREDTRVVEALGDGGLLPPRAAVVEALAVLNSADIIAFPGWRYLNEAAPAPQRAGLIAAHPAIVDGIVVADPSELDRAQQRLADARLLPTAAIAVADGASLLSWPTSDLPDAPDADTPTAPTGATPFVVEPTPAMYDLDAAGERRQELLARMSRRGELLESADKALTELREAAEDLRRWRRACPPGHLAQQRAAEEAAGATLTKASAELEDQVKKTGDAAAAQQLAVEQLRDAESAERAASERAGQLAGLADATTAVAGADAELTRLHHEASDNESAATRESSAATDLRKRAESSRRASDGAHAQAERHKRAAGGVVSSTGRVADQVPDQPLADLVAAAEAAHAAYLAAAADEDLRSRAEAMAGKLRDQTAVLERSPAEHVTRARELHATTAGSDPTAWDANLRKAREYEQELVGTVESHVALKSKLEAKVEDAKPSEEGRSSWVNLTPEWRPTTYEQGEQLRAQAAAAHEDAQRAVDGKQAEVTRLTAEAASADIEISALAAARLPLTTMLEDDSVPDGTDPFSGDVTAAQQGAQQALLRLRGGVQAVYVARTQLDDAIEELTAFANQKRYEQIDTVARRSIIDARPDTLALRAREWSQSLMSRYATLTADLDNATRIRKTIVERLAALTQDALKTLRRASRLSELPAGLGEWSGQTFLRIRFTDPDANAIQVRTGEVIDRSAVELAKASGELKGRGRDGRTLLIDAVHASVPNGFQVDVLKPDQVLRDERERIEDIGTVFSGGQHLTAAIVMYCTLAALNSNERGQMRAKHSGVLFLDNPIGRANAAYLIDLQQAVARSLGVQLVYTTGIFDDRVLAAFPLWVRLRNDADLRAGLKYIRVAEVVRPHLPDPFAAGEAHVTQDEDGHVHAPGTLTATRVLVKPRTPRATDSPRQAATQAVDEAEASATAQAAVQAGVDP